MEEIKLTPIGIVENSRTSLDDDGWGDVLSRIVLADDLGEDCLLGVEGFSHVEVIFYFHRADIRKTTVGSRRPRDNPAWPQVGIFAQRGKDRPNRLGLTVARVIHHERRSLTVQGLDAIHGTPVLDIKPVMVEFLPQGTIRQPEWVRELMQEYWRKGE